MFHMPDLVKNSNNKFYRWSL